MHMYKRQGPVLGSMLQIDPEREVVVRTFSASTPHDAAVRAASKGETLIVIATKEGKIHIYEGERVPLPSPNSYEQRRGITHRPRARKLCYFDSKERVDERSLPSLCDSIRRAIGS